MPLWIIAVEWIGRLILFVLLGLSVWSVSLMIDRRKTLKGLREAGAITALTEELRRGNLESLRKHLASVTTGLPAHATIQAAVTVPHPSLEAVDRAVSAYLTLERARLEKGLTVLATLGSNAPFVGLLGTVLGIIQAFGELSRQAGSTTSVMSGISEALVATAVGLVVAIPAVVAYNAFSKEVRMILTECESLRDLYLSQFKF